MIFVPTPHGRAVLSLVIVAAWLVLVTVNGEAGEQSRLTQNDQAAASMDDLRAPKEWMTEHSGGSLPLEAVFVDEQGRKVSLKELIDRPTLLLPVYFTCPSICSFDLANLATTIGRLTYHGEVGFRVVSLSFNTEDTPERARAAKTNYTHLLGNRLPPERWTFLTGEEAQILKVTQAIGYRFQRTDEGIFIHPSALVAVDKNGQIIKYIYGSFIPGDVDLALQEAAEGRPATSIRRVLAFCFPANPRQNAFVLQGLKIASVAVLIGGGLWLARLLRKRNIPPLPPS